MNRLSELQDEKGLNMKDPAKALSLPYMTYVNWVKGAREPNSEMLILLADFYDCSIDYLIGRTNDREAKQQAAVTKTEAELLRLFRSMSKDQQRLILSTAREIKK